MVVYITTLRTATPRGADPHLIGATPNREEAVVAVETAHLPSTVRAAAQPIACVRRRGHMTPSLRGTSGRYMPLHAHDSSLRGSRCPTCALVGLAREAHAAM